MFVYSVFEWFCSSVKIFTPTSQNRFFLKHIHISTIISITQTCLHLDWRVKAFVSDSIGTCDKRLKNITL